MKKPRLALAGALGHHASDKRIDLLRRVGEGGSISQAARAAGVSYKAAWQAIDTLSNLAGTSLVESAVGGAGGGGARLTAAGHELLRAADALAQSRTQVLGELGLGRARGEGAKAWSALGLRTSMRNQLPCIVEALEEDGPLVRVRVLLRDGQPLVSRITRESAELLALAPGQAVLVLCKATAVKVARTATARPTKGAIQLPARATRVSRGTSGDEVAAELGSGLQMVGFAPAASGLRARSRVTMAVDESALVIALLD